MQKWGLVGCGVIGERRALNLPEGVALSYVFDPNQDRAKLIAEKTNAKICSSLDDLISKDINAVVIASINSVLAPTLQQCLDKGLHVLVEKPAARSYGELAKIKNPKNCKIKIGFNHRFHPAYIDLLKELENQTDDPIMFVRAQYGNGARLGFEKEWRAQVDLSGGGELLDQGVHVLDLASGMLKNMQVKTAYVKTHYWNMSVDDNAWAILADANGATFTMHVSSSEWKNEFRFEVYTRKRKYQWLGLGRSYGPEKLLIHEMKPEMGPPLSTEKNYPPEDLSWKLENENFLNGYLSNKSLNGDYENALSCLKLVEDIYRKSSSLQNDKNHPVWFKE
jgi:predicted dehydrogenase